jgi:hypothetical protein
MAKRFTATEIWGEDWFLEMDNEYKLFWFYMLSKCDHAGVWKPNKKTFENAAGVKINLEKALGMFNADKERIFVTHKKNWWVVDFFVFQYGTVFNISNPLHDSIYKVYNQEDIDLTSTRGLKEVKWGTWSGLPEDFIGVKDKDKVSLYNSLKVKKAENGKSKREFVNFKAQPEEIFAERYKRNERAAIESRKSDN